MSRTWSPIYQVDAFSEVAFAGNPAAVCSGLVDRSSHVAETAAENNLADTAFLVMTETGIYDRRWFTPILK